MGLLKVAALGALGYLGYKYYEQQKGESRPAFADNQGADENFAQVRDSGPEAMADRPGDWSKADQASDESFPASDPPATY